MNAKVKNQIVKTSNQEADLQLAFDVGHSSLGWAVLQRGAGVPTAPVKIGEANLPINLLGCGVVTFRADDCLASTRRGYRRQRRHIRSTRQRIARMKILLAHLEVLKQAQLDTPGCAWPWNRRSGSFPRWGPNRAGRRLAGFLVAGAAGEGSGCARGGLHRRAERDLGPARCRGES